MATTDSATSPPVTPSVLLPPPIPPTSAPKAASSPVPPGPIVLNKHATSIAAQSDVAKYRGKYKELKSKNREIELENDQIHLKTIDLKRNIQRLRLERALLYERLETAYDPNVLGYDPTVLTQPDTTDTFMDTAVSTETQPHDSSAFASSPSKQTPSTSKFIPSVLQPPPQEVVSNFKPTSSSVSSHSNNRVAPANSARDYSSTESDDEDLEDEEEDEDGGEAELKDANADAPDAMEVDEQPPRNGDESRSTPAKQSGGNGMKVTLRRCGNVKSDATS